MVVKFNGVADEQSARKMRLIVDERSNEAGRRVTKFFLEQYHSHAYASQFTSYMKEY